MSIAKNYLYMNGIASFFHIFSIVFMAFSLKITHQPTMWDILFYALICNIVNFLMFIYFFSSRKDVLKENGVNFVFYSLATIATYLLAGFYIIGLT